MGKRPDLSFERLDSLVPWERNPRVNDHAVDRVARSIQRFGFLAPIVVNRSGRRILAGHTRYKAARRLGLAQVPVRWVDLPEAEASAYALADNRLGELAEWDDPELAKLLRDLQAEDVQVDDLGWTDDEIGELLSDLVTVGEHQRARSGDQRPAPRPVPGRAVLKVGDCLEHLRALPDASIDAVVTDPPYGLSEAPDMRQVLQCWLADEHYEHGKPGFMENEWDSFVPGPKVWREVFRVLKPGGHLIAFAGTRTADLMGISIRLGGPFELRDLGEWLYWNGFPKNQDLAKLLDKRKANRADVLRICHWVREARDAAGITNGQIDEHFGLTGMAAHWATRQSQPLVPTAEQWPELLQLLGAEPPPEIAELAARIIRPKGQPGEAWFKRRVTGEQIDLDTTVTRPGMPVQDIQYRRTVRTEAATEEARTWAGWGTALNPAHEPFLVFRKPFDKSDMTLADNVLKYGTGALNLRACAVPPGDPMWPAIREPDDRGPRWPPNALYCPKPSRDEKEAGLESLPARTGAEAVKRKPGSKGMDNPRAGAGRTARELRNVHPTVKPLRLFAWLVRLVTPPGGKVLDPFMGSGTTGAAAVPQGFEFEGYDLEPVHVQIAEQRIAYWTEHGLDAVIGYDPAEVETVTTDGDTEDPGE